MRIKLELAKLAQEKGFEQSTGSKCWVTTLDGKFMHNSERDQNNPCHDRTTSYLSQPTQTDLQKWLRETHKIEVIPEPDVALFVSSGQVLGYTFSIYTLDSLIENTTGFDKYEEAMEAGLTASLKTL